MRVSASLASLYALGSRRRSCLSSDRNEGGLHDSQSISILVDQRSPTDAKLSAESIEQTEQASLSICFGMEGQSGDGTQECQRGPRDRIKTIIQQVHTELASCSWPWVEQAKPPRRDDDTAHASVIGVPVAASCEHADWRLVSSSLSLDVLQMREQRESS